MSSFSNNLILPYTMNMAGHIYARQLVVDSGSLSEFLKAILYGFQLINSAMAL
jgi:hypothetical protein